ncbi:hypothetical protein GPECTOR_202g374 [Gonium pectorale]|uniref:Poly(A) RNA polymerase mitochondrial-like central palm domain-containing protein n=1 Tax=Gonium pectorale TaxID=33097 RepID=A0A150FWX2_GONPE|nr:hypothetical protein GPECTOR_202g374 [Gonium pectorale]|eukprot:KXZ42112.1 hypothetical protein GPECTOR_202g374 [Gonium pectorale]
MMPGLLHLRLGASGCVGAGLRTSVRTCALTRAASGRSSPAIGGVSSLHLLVDPQLGARALSSARPCRAAAAAAVGAASSSLSPPTAAAAGAASALPPFFATSAAAAATGVPLGHRQRHLSTRTYAVAQSGPGAANDGGAGKKGGQKAPHGGKGKQPPAPPPPPPPAPAVQPGAAAAAAAPPPPPVRYSPLHHNIEEFCTRVVLTEGEKRQRMEVIEALRASVRRVWPNTRSVELQVFGSFANGLSTWNSDLDLVVTGIFEPDRLSGGYEPADRAKITSKLRKLSEALNRGKQIDILWTKSRVCVDVSMSDDSGPRAARYMVQQCRAYPPLKPLVLVLKAYLKACRLNEVNSGGLSSYSLTNMVIAHLQEELKSGHDISDLGETLYTFLLRYGEEHDYNTQAVSVASGGIVPKSSLGFAMESARQAAASMGSYDGAVAWHERLCVDCPLTGRDVSNGSYRIDLVRGAFVQAARKLEALARGRRISDTSLNYLQALFDVNRVLKRSYPDPHEPYEDEYLKVIGGRSMAEEEEGEDLPLSEGSGPEEDDDLGGDYLERAPTAATGSRQQARR